MPIVTHYLQPHYWIVSAVAELERSLIVERVRAGMRRARLEGRQIGRAPLALDREAICSDRRRGLSIRQVAREHGISTATVQRVLKEQAAEPKPAQHPYIGVAQGRREPAA